MEQRQVILAGGQYLSHSQTQRTFAAGSGEMSLEVRWTSGRISRIPGVQANRLYEIDEAGAATFSPPTSQPPAITWFTNVSSTLGHTHAEPGFDDFGLQPLLPQRYSQLGPGVAWFDFNGDGHDDLIVGTGRDGRPAIHLGNGKGTFSPLGVAGPTVPDDLGAILGWVGSGGSRAILGGLANYESGGSTAAASALQWHPGATGAEPGAPLPGGGASPGPLAVGDVDGDGDLDVFVGARLTARRWPQSGGSRFFRNDHGTLTPEDPAVWNAVEPVSDALFADLDGDGRPELILACELGPIRVFSRKDQGWTERTRALGLEPWTGWWNSVAVGDFNGDGFPDLIAGNRGRNSLMDTWSRGRTRIFAGDFDHSGIWGVVESADQDGALRPLRDRKTLSASLPELPSRFPTHTAFANADVRSVLGPNPGPVLERSTSTQDSVILLNRGDHFDLAPLPLEAQWSPTHGIAVADFDGDGAHDLFLAQNLFAVRPEDTRMDAGRGLVLRGNGRGGFAPVPGDRSGVALYGEQRGAAAGDYDEDGRMDLVVGQNGAATQLLHNTGARPGLRVRLVGPRENPDGIGAVIRPIVDGKPGAAQVVTAGGGYWSQPSSTVVLGGDPPNAVSVQWPDGTKTQVTVPPGAREVRATHP